MVPQFSSPVVFQQEMAYFLFLLQHETMISSFEKKLSQRLNLRQSLFDQRRKTVATENGLFDGYGRQLPHLDVTRFYGSLIAFRGKSLYYYLLPSCRLNSNSTNSNGQNSCLLFIEVVLETKNEKFSEISCCPKIWECEKKKMSRKK